MAYNPQHILLADAARITGHSYKLLWTLAKRGQLSNARRELVGGTRPAWFIGNDELTTLANLTPKQLKREVA